MIEKIIWQRAITLAKKGALTCAPNPMVGAVLVKGGKIIGEGYHIKAGSPHAEVRALRDAFRKGHDPKGATLFVTLEPCSTTGRTPPCTEAIINAKIAEVRIGTTDPNPKHRGRAVKILEACKIKVRVENLPECAALNERFNHFMKTGRPFIHAKWAMSLDGKMAAKEGERYSITNEKSLREAHKLRALYDAVLIGKGTVLADDPALSIRLSKKVRQPYKIILDSRASLSYTGRLAEKTEASKIIVAVSKKAPEKRVLALRERGLTVIRTSGTSVNLPELLKALGALGISGILVEGGPKILSAFFAENLVDKISVFIAPKILGGKVFPLPENLRVPKLLQNFSLRRIKDDLLFEGYPK